MLPSSENQVKTKETLHPLDYKRYQKALQKKAEIIRKISKTQNYCERRKI